MLVSTTSQYAIRILLYMSGGPGKKFSAAELIRELNISDKYLRRVMTGLAKSGFIRSIPGRNGGYVFNKSVYEITIGDIVYSIEEKTEFTKCILGFQSCDNSQPCKLHVSWGKIRDDIFNMFENTTLGAYKDIKAIQF